MERRALGTRIRWERIPPMIDRTRLRRLPLSTIIALTWRLKLARFFLWPFGESMQNCGVRQLLAPISEAARRTTPSERT
ncbi:MAG: hypothetical protein FD172_3832 [Methylocystaceae bacterium]|nr:MAG: hypothetical protein FD172_3832 [Methylocystaceae bacterium]